MIFLSLDNNGKKLNQ